MKFLKYLREKYYSPDVLKTEWVFCFLTGLLISVSLSYTDLISFTVWSTNILDCIADGNITGYHAYAIHNLHNAPHGNPGAGFLMLSLWAVWNIPVWIAQRFFGIEAAGSALSLLWSRMFLAALEAVMLIYAYRICMKLTENKSKSIWCCFLTASSVFTYLQVYHAGQSDIVMVTASVIAVYYLLNDNWKLFNVWSLIAIAIKPFYFMAYFVIILLTNKNVLKIAAYSLLGMSGSLFQMLIYAAAPKPAEYEENTAIFDMFSKMFYSHLHTTFGDVSFFVAAAAVICFYSYSRFFDTADQADKKLYHKNIIYLVTLIYLAYVILTPSTHYRPFLVLPFLCILIVQNEKIYLYNIILDTLLNFSVFAAIILRRFNTFVYEHANISVLSDITGIKTDTFQAICVKASDTLYEKFPSLTYAAPIIYAIPLTAAILIAVINYPGKETKLPYDGSRCPRVLIWGRMLIILPITLMYIMQFFNLPHLT